ncbi:hypothetical protein AVDCRST_MAG94-1659 [uncultured Leptolyngbya sp.]|uniref:Uncharacterized protein n=1 Tax=uncultured Leptolyngbya sp. TaxID=332963 RepID=A0A6J4LCY8_9CYAN|nr:hypothetical protein AVDCRST_MAG94-1659 [uncultured Leptolyngbya sp.]
MLIANELGKSAAPVDVDMFSVVVLKRPVVLLVKGIRLRRSEALQNRHHFA